MKLSLSLLWRIFALQLLVGLALVLALRDTALFHDISYIPWKATIGFSFLAIALVLCQTLAKFSLLRLVFGARLQLDETFWRSLSFALSALFIALAIANIAVAQMASFETWNLYKLVAPILSILIFVAIVPPYLTAIRAQQ